MCCSATKLLHTDAPAKTYLHHLCTDIECSLEDMPEAMDERDGW